MLDAFDAMLYALVLAHVMRELGMSKGTAGFLQMLTLLASGVGRRVVWLYCRPHRTQDRP